MVIDTLFMCFCEDVSQNDGSPGKEHYAPPSLMAFMNESSEEGAGGGDRNPDLPMQSMPRRQVSKEEAV